MEIEGIVQKAALTMEEKYIGGYFVRDVVYTPLMELTVRVDEVDHEVSMPGWGIVTGDKVRMSLPETMNVYLVGCGFDIWNISYDLSTPSNLNPTKIEKLDGPEVVYSVEIKK